MSQSPNPAPHAAEAPPRIGRKTEIGVITSDRMNKTRRVEISRLVPHPKYGKYVRGRTICYAHDEINESHIGDTVEIMETRPLSKLKRWRVTRIVRPGSQRALGGEGETAARDAGA
jgi:small subunit ribosomal protein S17